MAYKSRELAIVPGGLKLLQPSDKIGEGDCLQLNDWWPGASGRLEQSPQLSIRSSGSNFGKDSLLKADGRVYYGGNGNLSQIGRGTIDTGYDGYPLGLISMQGYAWIMNRAKQRRDNGTTVSDWWIGNADQGLTLTDLGAVGGLNGHEYEYYITWFVAGLGETNPGPVAPLTVADGHAIRCARPDISDAPAGATGWNVYRQDYIDTDGIAHFGIAYLVNPTPIPIDQTTYDDYGDAAHNQDDTSIRELGVIMETDHDAPPAARVVANQTFNGRILVANSAEHPNRIWYTPALQPGYFRGSDNPNEGDWIDIGTDKGDQILAIAVRPLTVIVYRERSIWRILGDFDDANSRIDPMVPELGIVGPRGMVSTSVGDYFVASARRGVYRFNNDWAQKLSDDVDPIFRGLETENFPQLGTGYDQQTAVGFRDGRLWVSYPNSSGFPAGSLIYHAASQRWFSGSFAVGAFLDAGDEFLGINGDVVALEKKYVGASTVLGFQSQYHNAGLPDHEKTWADLVLQHNTHGATLTIDIRTNKNADPSIDSFTLATISSNAMTKQIIPLLYPADYAVVELQGKPIRSYSLSVRITGNGADDRPAVIDGAMLIHYYLEARQARGFDSDETGHGTEKVKVVDMLEFDIDASAGDAFAQVYGDVTGGRQLLPVLGTDGQLIAKTTGRESRRLVLTDQAVGKLLRYTAQTNSEFQIYGLRARVLPIGVYLDGVVHDFWQPQPISIGV